MKNLLFILSTCCCILTVSALDIAVNRKACVQIVVNPAAGKLEKMAAADLKKFLEECTQAKFQIVPENAAIKSTPKIYLGSTLFAEKTVFLRRI
jgi:BioD-like phosphotransacetylase family protein